MPEARYAVGFSADTSGLDASVSALESLKSSIASDRAELSQLNTALRTLKGAAGDNASALTELRDRISAKNAALAESTKKLLEVDGGFKNLKSGAEGAAGGEQILNEQMKKALGPMGEKLDKLKALVGVIGQYGLVAGAALAAAAIAVVTAVVVASVAKLTQFAIVTADAARAQGLLSEALTGSEAGGKAFESSIASVATRVPLAVDGVRKLARSLHDAGLSGGELERALEAASMQEGMGLDGGKFVELAKQAKATGKSVDELSSKVKSKLGGVAGKAMLGLEMQGLKLKESINAIFADIKIDAFLEMLSGVTKIFDQSTASGKALKRISETMLQPLVDSLSVAGPQATAFFKGLVIGGLLVAIAFVKAKKALEDAFGTDVGQKIDTIKLAMYAGAAATIVLVLGLVALAAILALLGVVAVGVGLAMAMVMAPFIIALAIVGALLYGLVVIFVAVKNAVVKNLNEMKGLGFWEIGWAIVKGIGQGLAGGVGTLIAQVKGVAKSMINAAKDVLGIASPSKVFAEIGGFTAQGMTAGIESEASSVTGAMSEMVSPPKTDTTSSNASSGGRNLSLTINVSATGEGADGIAKKIKDVVLTMLTEESIAMGAV